MCACDKPNSKIFKYLLNKMAVLPSQTIMIGDDYAADIKGAHNVGIKTIHLKNNRLRNINMELVKPDYTKNNYKDILKLVKRLTPNR
jgi:FMN phosphatase YigB (HAD superfamily)